MPPKDKETEQIKLQSLSAQQLSEFRSNLNGEIQRLGEGVSTLGRLANTFASTKKTVEQLGVSQEGQAILLPLTGSLYVPGEIAAVDKVMVDIGTGYYVEMGIEDAKKYCDRRMKHLQDSIQGISMSLRERQGTLMDVQSVYAEKVQAMQRQQQAAQGAGV